MLDVVTIQPNGTPQLSVIWLHGLGADAHDFEPIVPHLNIPANFSVRFVFPNAPVQPVTINMGMSMRAWYDIISPVIGAGHEDADGIRKSSLELEQLIDHEIAQGMNSDQIVLAGFSQGGAVALFTGLRYPKRLSGILALSTYLPLQKVVTEERSEANEDIPILSLHGDFDPVISIAVAEQYRSKLSELGYSFESKNYPAPHSVTAEEVVNIGNWLTQRCQAV